MELKKFIVKAKIKTYASSGEAGEKILEDGSKELTYGENDFKYRDRYFGFNPFVGEEVIWHKEELVWGMNYYGEVISKTIPVKQVYQFLQKALKQVTEDKPFRGPNNFKEGDFEYFNESRGTIEGFVGVEKILYQGKEIYKLYYHGGIIKKK